MNQLNLPMSPVQCKEVPATHWAHGRYFCATCVAEYWRPATQPEELSNTRYVLDGGRHCYKCCPCQPCRAQAEEDIAKAGDVYLDMYRSKRAWREDTTTLNLLGDAMQAMVALHQNQPPTDYPQLQTNLEELAFQADEKRARPHLGDKGKPSTQQTAASILGAAANAATRQDPEELKRFFGFLGRHK